MTKWNNALLRCGVYLMAWCLIAAIVWQVSNGVTARAQEGAAGGSDPAAGAAVAPAAAPAAGVVGGKKDDNLTMWDFYWLGGFFMHPILLMCFIMVTVTIERLIGLRRAKVAPPEIVAALGNMGESRGGFDPREAYKICQQYPSAVASVVKAMLLKIGRPLPEIEGAVKDAKDQEATLMYGNVRWLNLCSTIAPMLGLIGTIQGMIEAFHRMTSLDPGANKANELAGGIYTALITTFGGLVVAIPAAVASFYFEGVIQNMFIEIDRLVGSLLPQAERYEGRVRFGRNVVDGEGGREPGPRVNEPASIAGKA